jgi:hypothetical protein
VNPAVGDDDPIQRLREVEAVLYRQRGLLRFDLEDLQGRSLAEIRMIGMGMTRRILARSRLGPFVILSLGLFLPGRQRPSMTLVRPRMRERAVILDGGGVQQFVFRGVFTVRRRTFLIMGPSETAPLGRLWLQPGLGRPRTVALAGPSDRLIARIEDRPRAGVMEAIRTHDREFVMRRSARVDAQLTDASLWALPVVQAFYANTY